jgi:hypothetical protein
MKQYFYGIYTPMSNTFKVIIAAPDHPICDSFESDTNKFRIPDILFPTGSNNFIDIS